MVADATGYRDWRSLELAIKDSARAAVHQGTTSALRGNRIMFPLYFRHG